MDLANLERLRLTAIVKVDIAVNRHPPAQFECWHLDVYSGSSARDWQCRWSQATIIA